MREFEPRLARRRLRLLKELTTVNFGGEIEFMENFLRWETDVREYQGNSGKNVDPELLIAVVVEGAPEKLFGYLKSRLDDIGEDYAK